VPALEKTKCPVLVLIGEKDLQVDPKLNLPPIRAALKKSGNSDVTITQLDSLNHLFQECETGSPGEYGSIEQTFSPKALELMSQWIGKRFVNLRHLRTRALIATFVRTTSLPPSQSLAPRILRDTRASGTCSPLLHCRQRTGLPCSGSTSG